MIISLLQNILHIALIVAPFFLLGLFVSGLIKSFLSESLIKKHLSGKGVSPVLKASAIGMPLPLCSCGVIPVALGLRKQGASKGATASFMISTPETGVDSISVSFVLLGPVLAIIRPISAFITSIVAGVLIDKLDKEESIANIETNYSSCCSKKSGAIKDVSTQNNIKNSKESSQTGFISRFIDGQKYSMTVLYNDTFKWLSIGIIAAGAIITFVPDSFFAEYGNNIWGMLVIMLISIPMYTCATSSTPIAAGLIAVGISPGAALIFLLAGPATNVATLGIVKKQLGTKSLVIYLSTIAICALVMGYITNLIFNHFNLSIANSIGNSEHFLPSIIYWTALFILVVFQKNIWSFIINLITRNGSNKTTSKKKSCCKH